MVFGRYLGDMGVIFRLYLDEIWATLRLYLSEIWMIFRCYSGDIWAIFGLKSGAEINESLDGVSVSTSFVQSRLVSVSTSSKFPSLNEFRSRHPPNFQVSMSLGLDIQQISQS